MALVLLPNLVARMPFATADQAYKGPSLLTSLDTAVLGSRQQFVVAVGPSTLFRSGWLEPVEVFSSSYAEGIVKEHVFCIDKKSEQVLTRTDSMEGFVQHFWQHQVPNNHTANSVTIDEKQVIILDFERYQP